MSRLLVNVQYNHHRDPFPEPTLIAHPMAGLGDSEPVLGQDDHWNCDAFDLADVRNNGSFAVGNCGQGVRVQNQRHISGSIFSVSSSIRRSRRSVSLCKCFSRPISFSQGFSLTRASVASLSFTASVTNSRKGIPRAAATDLARRKTGSGISSVVFIIFILPYLWELVNHHAAG